MPIQAATGDAAASLGHELRILIKRAGFKSQSAFAKSLPIDKGAVSRWLTGERLPDPNHLNRLLDAVEAHEGQALGLIYREKLHALLIDALLARDPQAQAAVTELKRQMEQARDQALAATLRSEALETQLEDCRVELEAALAARDATSAQVATLTARIERLEARLHEAQQQAADARRAALQVVDEAMALRGQILARTPVGELSGEPTPATVDRESRSVYSLLPLEVWRGSFTMWS